MARELTKKEFFLLVDMFDLETSMRGITFREENVRGLAFDDYVRNYLENGLDDYLYINILDGMTCERDKDWYLQQLKS